MSQRKVKHFEWKTLYAQGIREFTVFPSAEGITIYGKDITERKKAEEALRENERRLNRSQEIARLGSWELDLQSNQLTWSDEVYRIFGLKPQQFGATYEAFLKAVHPDDRAAVDAAYFLALCEKEKTVMKLIIELLGQTVKYARYMKNAITSKMNLAKSFGPSGWFRILLSARKLKRKLQGYLHFQH